jgi:hypothetical protein
MPNYKKDQIIELINKQTEQNKSVLSFLKEKGIHIKSIHDAIQQNLHYLYNTQKAIEVIPDNSENINLSITEFNKIQQ